MARKLVKISLGTKLRIVFAAAVLGIITVALMVPWYLVEQLGEQGLQRPVGELTRLRLNEFVRDHPDPNTSAGGSEVAALYTMVVGEQEEGRKGPAFIDVRAQAARAAGADSAVADAKRAFTQNPDQDFATVQTEDERGRTIYRCFRAVRSDAVCQACHGPSAAAGLQFQPGELVGMIDLSIPASVYRKSDPLAWVPRVAFIGGGALATILAVVVFALIVHRLILRPLRQLKTMADKVADGDLAVRSTIQTGDELQRLGESFNEMLEAIGDQHEKLRTANRALDLKLHELAEANVTLFQANQVKSEFLTNVSHELRTPLNSIIGFADLVAEEPDARIKRFGQNIVASAKTLLSMINDLLDLAKIEAGKAEVRLDKVSITDTCQTLLALVRPLADKKQLDLRGELAADVPIVVTDAGKVQQVLYNLLSNAVKFTPVGGRVTVTTAVVRTARDGRGVEEVSIAVADTGPGLAEADQQRIFEKFYQADRTLTKEAAGTGLGLSIAKELASLLGGRLTLASQPGHGAVFTFFLPVNPSCLL